MTVETFHEFHAELLYIHKASGECFPTERTGWGVVVVAERLGSRRHTPVNELLIRRALASLSDLFSQNSREVHFTIRFTAQQRRVGENHGGNRRKVEGEGEENATTCIEAQQY